MGQRAAKATNRDIRRAFGPDALDVINQQGETLQSVILPRLMTLGKEAETVDRRLGSLEQRASDASVELAAIRFMLAEQPTTFVGRLRWLVGL